MKPDQHPTLTVADLHVHYGTTCALRDVTFAVNAGHTVAIAGRNGAGKSTLLKALAGLVTGLTGTVVWDGRPLDQKGRRGLMAYLPQREEVDWNFPMTVRGLVDMGLYAELGPWRSFGKRHRTRVAAAIARMGLDGLEDRLIGQLSGGQQQRAFLARAVAGGSPILLFDEPFSGLDAEASANLANYLKELAAEGTLVLASHHDLKSIPETFDFTLLLRTSQLAFGPSDEILTDARIREAFG